MLFVKFDFITKVKNAITSPTAKRRLKIHEEKKKNGKGKGFGKEKDVGKGISVQPVKNVGRPCKKRTPVRALTFSSSEDDAEEEKWESDKDSLDNDDFLRSLKRQLEVMSRLETASKELPLWTMILNQAQGAQGAMYLRL